MATALDVIKRSLRLLGVYAIGEDPSSEESSDALTALNAMIGTLSNGAMVYAKSLDSIAITAGTTSITVGPSGGTVTTRPVQVLDDSYVLVGIQTYALKVLTLQEYSDIGNKTVQAIPQGIWPQMDMPDATITFWPVPDQAMTLKLWSSKVFASFPALTTTVTLPPGYEETLALLLAERLAPEYQVEPSPTLKKLIANTRRTLEAANFQAPMLSMPAEVASSQRFNILTNTVS